VDPISDPLLLRKSGSAENRTRTSGSVAKNFDQYTTDKRLGKIFWHKKYSEREQCRIIRNRELHDLSRRRRPCIRRKQRETRNTYRILVMKDIGKL
jgi:hypothetical protein